MIQIEFHGGAGTVTGSKHLLRVNNDEVLIDCGMFQGLKELRQKNWSPPIFDPAGLRWVLLTHAHLDHSGWLPRLVRHGFRGRILCTAATRDVAQIILMDSAKLQMEEAQYRNRRGITSHQPALPLYTQEDVLETMPFFQTVEYARWVELTPQISFQLVDVGHILGSGAIELRLQDERRTVRVLASGDVGRYDMPLHRDPQDAPECDALLLESTYGARAHLAQRPEEQLLAVARKVVERKGILLIPAFAVGRSQQVIFVLHQLFDSGRLPRIPVYLDSPMGINATKVYCSYAGPYRLDAEALRGGVCTLFGKGLKIVKTPAQSARLAGLKGPAVIISSNGMLTGGRVLHHLRNLLPNPRNLVAMVGYQAAGSRGRYLIDGAQSLRILRDEVPVRAEVADLKAFSGHADVNELLRWTRNIHPRQCFLVHGEPQAAEALALRLREERDWNVSIARLGERVEL
ncbi:MAG: MBL fold metallo-hydrolase [Elusimicrobia bacterium]|nr:MBL fold metallo-hydrolase [Elusimicrobiota bacterium]